MTPLYSEISVESIISRCKLQMRIIDSAQDNYLAMLIYEGLDHLNALSMLVKKQCEIVVTDKTAKLPKDLVRFLGARLCCDGATVNANNTLLLYADTKFLNNCKVGTEGFVNYIDYFQINNGFIHFGRDMGIDKVVIAYLALNTDEDGNTVIHQKYERALTNYACYMFALSFNEDFNQYTIEKYNQTWVEQKNYLKGKAVMEDFELNKREISELMNSFIFGSNGTKHATLGF